MTEARGPEPVIQAFFDEPTNTVSYIVPIPRRSRRPSSIRCSTTTTTAAASTPAPSRRC